MLHFFFLSPHCGLCHGLQKTTKRYCYSSGGAPGRTGSNFALLISFDKDGNSDSRLKSGKLICQCDQYFDIFSSKCKKKLHHTCDKRISNNKKSKKNLFKRKELVRAIGVEKPGIVVKVPERARDLLFDCIKRIGGAATEIARIPKKMEHLQTDQAVLLRNYTYFFLSDEKFMDFFDQWNNSMIIVPYKVIPYTELYGFSPKHHFLRNRTCANPEIIYQSFVITPDCNSNGTIYNITKDVTYWINITNGLILHTTARC